MWKKVLVVIAALAVLIGGIAWTQRNEILLYIIANKDRVMPLPNHAIAWDQGPDKTAATPNIVFILLDDVGINDLSVLGGGIIQTPNIDQLAAEGVLFTNAYAGSATCAPSRAALMTGRYSTRTGFEFTPLPNGLGRISAMIGNSLDRGGLPYEYNQEAAEISVPFEDQGLPGSEITMAELLKEQGYHTVHIGKWHLGRGRETLPNAQGFDESLMMASMKYLPDEDPNVVNAKLSFDPIDKFIWARTQHAVMWNGGDWFRPDGYLTDYFTEQAEAAITANNNRPFFLYLAHWGAHTPLQATKEDYEAVGPITPDRARVYAGMIRSLDRSVGRVMARLETEGVADNTIVVLSSDNGGAGYIGLPKINAPYRGWKSTMFEGGIRVPLIMRWPGNATPDSTIQTPVSHIDVMPTLVAASGGSLPTDRVIDGRDLTTLMQGGRSVNRSDDAIYWSSGYYRVVRAGDWKLQVNQFQNETWLYDLATDPTEQHNLTGQNPQKQAELQALIDAHWQDAVDPLYPHTLEWPVYIDKTLADPYEADDAYVYWPN